MGLELILFPQQCLLLPLLVGERETVPCANISSSLGPDITAMLGQVPGTCELDGSCSETLPASKAGLGGMAVPTVRMNVWFALAHHWVESSLGRTLSG